MAPVARDEVALIRGGTANGVVLRVGDGDPVAVVGNGSSAVDIGADVVALDLVATGPATQDHDATPAVAGDCVARPGA